MIRTKHEGFKNGFMIGIILMSIIWSAIVMWLLINLTK
jgi:hypothetical protein